MVSFITIIGLVRLVGLAVIVHYSTIIGKVSRYVHVIKLIIALSYILLEQNHKRMLKALFEEQIRPYYGIYDFIIYTDGSFYHHQQKGGAGIVFEINDARNCSIPLPMAKSSIDAEALAILHALSMIMCNASVVICTDCLSVIDGVNHGTADCSYIRQLKLVIALRPGITKLMKVPAHAGVVGNEMADHLAKLGSHQAFSLPVPN
ncbi:ribonuclease H-like domain-containing protein [Syncephalastrum racemosum]|uniref:ribonuclease H n=1 Tax=Syncephalastrum racemosum TaxID=13706 RepID=A0A1X2HCD3_SYNRA|nr:ribonuclease H-like domain-containing protein [Syncephalastrum racemosum]